MVRYGDSAYNTFGKHFSVFSSLNMLVAVTKGMQLVKLLVHGQVTIIFVVSVCLFVCLCSFSQPSSIRFGSN